MIGIGLEAAIRFLLLIGCRRLIRCDLFSAGGIKSRRMYFSTDLQTAQKKYFRWKRMMKRKNLRCPKIRRNTSDLAVFKELMISKVYQPFKGSGVLDCFGAKAGESLLDVGGNVGLACWSYWHFNQVRKGDCYEPSRGCKRASAHSQ